MSDDKRKALEQAIAQIEKTYGKGSIMKMDEENFGDGIEVIPTGCLPLDIALGVGGLPRGRIIEIYGPESSGKTTVALHVIAEAQKMGGTAAFIDAEHALDPIYAQKLGVDIGSMYVSQPDTGEQALEITEQLVRSGGVDIVVIDSIQTMASSLLDSSPGSVSQIRECAATLLKYAKSTGTAIFIIGHITKEGTIAGPKVLEHIVDVVLQFEGDNNSIYRILRGIKNRFGATFEIGVFEMTGKGLRCVDNPSEILLTHYAEPLSGVSVGASVDGVRPYLIEVQALVSQAAYGTPQRNTTGFDSRRMNMLLAVVEKRVGLKMFQKDVFLNFAGGFKVADTGLDLAVIAAVLSSYFDTPLKEGLALAGEIGLSGEVRPAPRTEQRVAEAARLGFKRIVISGYAPKMQKSVEGIEVVRIYSVSELAAHIFERQTNIED